MTPAQVLLKAADLLEKPGAWVQFHRAVDDLGKGVSPSSEMACSWCALGAIHRVGGIYHSSSIYEAIEAIEGTILASVTRWNDMDGQTNAKVVSTLRDVARKLESAT